MSSSSPRRVVTALTIWFFAVMALFAIAADDEDTPVYKLREPRAWGAIYKYCLPCHEPSVLDGAVLSDALWAERIDQCVLKMASQGYPLPTKEDKEALLDFLPGIEPADRKPPVYLWPPKRGGLAVP